VILAARSSNDDVDSVFVGLMFVLMGMWMLLVAAGYAFGIWALVEILRYREDEFEAVGRNRTTWLVLQIVGLALCQPMSAVVGVLFLWKHRPALRAWREAHPPPPPWYAPPGYWYPPTSTYAAPAPPAWPPGAAPAQPSPWPPTPPTAPTPPEPGPSPWAAPAPLPDEPGVGGVDPGEGTSGGDGSSADGTDQEPPVA